MPVKRLLDAMDAAGVHGTVIVQPFSAYGFDNAYHSDSAARYPQRLVGVCAVDPLASDAVERLQYWIDERGMRGLRLTSHRVGVLLDDPRSFPLWERARELGIPVCIATMPAHWSSVERMVKRYPDVAIVLEHGGGIEAGTPETLQEQLLVLAALPNLYLKLTTLNFAGLNGKAGTRTRYLKALVDRYGAERVMWGSNFPASLQDGYAGLVNLGRQALSFVSDKQRRWLLADTAVKLWPQLNV